MSQILPADGKAPSLNRLPSFTASLEAPPIGFVSDLSVSIQRGFRRKLLALLLLQLLLSLSVGLSLRFAIPADTLLQVFPGQDIQTYIIGALCIVTLPALSVVRTRHPWNLVATTAWSIAWGVFLGASQVSGGIIVSNGLFICFGAISVAVATLLVCSQLSVRGDYADERKLLSFTASGGIAWLVMVAAAVTVYALTPGLTENIAHFAGAMIFASVLLAWVCVDAQKLCNRMEPDEYLKGVTGFYCDFCILCCCCAIAGCVSSATT